jgi:hypothetical protein
MSDSATTDQVITVPATNVEDTSTQDAPPSTPMDGTTEEQEAAAKAAAEEAKAMEAFEVKSKGIKLAAERLLSELYKDPDSKDSQEAKTEASKEVITSAYMICSVHLQLVNEDKALDDLPKSVIDVFRASLNGAKKEAVLKALRWLHRQTDAMAAEALETYSNLGPVYGGIPSNVDLGLEFGIQTGEGEDLRRTGIVFGLRCDHLSGRRPARKAPKLFG